MTPQELIAKLEAATGPERELDAAIYWAQFGKTSRPVADAESETPFSDFYKRSEANGMPPFDMAVPRYTASIEAAMSLVPEGYLPDVASSRHEGNPFYLVSLWRPMDRENPTIGHSNLAIALTIAALKARSAT